MAQEIKLDRFLDALKEVGNIGAGKSSGVLSKFTGEKVVLTTPDIFLTKTEDLPRLIGGPQQLIVGMYSSIEGDVSGTLMLTLTSKDAMKIIDLLEEKKTGQTIALDNKAQNKLKKVGEIISQSYLSSISEFLKIKVKKNKQKIITAFGESIPDLLLFGIKKRYALFISTEFKIEKSDIKGKFAMILATESIQKMLDAIKKQEK